MLADPDEVETEALGAIGSGYSARVDVLQRLVLASLSIDASSHADVHDHPL
jgi:hypothetical protein